VKWFHITLTEIARCFKIDKKICHAVELILRATVEHNKTLHSVFQGKPVEILHTGSDDRCLDIKVRLIKAQQNNIERSNAARRTRVFEVGDEVFVKNNKRLGNKLTPLCTEQKVQTHLGTSVLIKGRVVHKDNLKEIPPLLI